MNDTPYLEILKYYLTAKTKRGKHPVFITDFIETVLDKKVETSIFESIEQERIRLESSKETISFIEYGAGSKQKNGSTRKVAQVAKSSLSQARQCRVMYNLLKKYEASNIIELGTSLGISTCYLSKGVAGGSLNSLEGNPASIKIAKDVFQRLGCKNINVVEGEFGKTLKKTLDHMQTVDVAFVDGNHRMQATIDYFEEILPYTHKQSCIMIDDIYWSKGMHKAWQSIINHKEVAFSIDIFRMGIVFFDKEILDRQHFKLIDSWFG